MPNDEIQQESSGTGSLLEIVSQLEDLIKFVLEYDKKEIREPIPYNEINKQLAHVKDMLAGLHISFEETLRSLALSEEDIKKARAEIEKSQGGPEKQMYDRLENLKKLCEEQKALVHASLLENKEQAKQVEEDLLEENVRSKKRKGKFKRTGAKKGWLPS